MDYQKPLSLFIVMMSLSAVLPADAASQSTPLFHLQEVSATGMYVAQNTKDVLSTQQKSDNPDTAPDAGKDDKQVESDDSSIRGNSSISTKKIGNTSSKSAEHKCAANGCPSDMPNGQK